MSFKNIRIKKRGGGTRLQRVKVLKSGKFKFVKNIKSRVSRRKTKSNPKKRRKTNLARRKKRGNRTRKFRVYLAPTVGAMVGLIEPFQRARHGDIMGAVDELGLAYVGYSPRSKRFSGSSLKRGLLPLLVGTGISIAASKIGLNRKLGQARVPLVRI